MRIDKKGDMMPAFKDFYRFTKALEEQSRGYKVRTIPFCDGILKVFCVLQLTDRDMLTKSVIRPLVLHCKTETIKSPISSCVMVLFY